ncbi:MAG: nucleotidyltransferase domain-containing protein [Clostridia bacterium]|nr:nucleotidyltransferase domain-containing protein [Clostridia bacterium]
MVKRNVDLNVLKSVEEYIKEISKYYSIQEVYLFGSYAKGTSHEDSDIDVAVIINSDSNVFDLMVELMMLTQNIDLRIEPHPIKVKDFKEGNPFVQEIIDTGIKVA